MFDVGGGTDRFFDRIDDALFDIERRCALVNDPDERDRNLNVRKEIDRQAFQRGGSQDHHSQGQHQDADAIAECEECQPHNEYVNGDTRDVTRREVAINGGNSFTWYLLRLTFHGIHRLRLDGDAFADEVFSGDDQVFVARKAFHHFDAVSIASAQLDRHLMGLPFFDDIDIL